MWKVECDDGFQVVSRDPKELAALTQWHVKNAHHKDVSHQEVLKMARHP